MAGNADFDQILSTTLKNYIPKLTDNIFSARPLFYALTNGQTIRRISGGANIVVPNHLWDKLNCWFIQWYGYY